MQTVIHVNAAQFTTLAEVEAATVTLARIHADVSGAEADTLARLVRAALAAGVAKFEITIEGGDV
jgi:hypothetical protein